MAEVAARKSLVERKRFYEIARSSLVEIDTQLEISINLRYFSRERIAVLEEKMNYLFAMLSKLIQSGQKE
ncbi:four helix bundle protein [candidate division KSB1 bacterium]|nr:four helix bundle protein [candidate division KSB1 bacterium]NIR69441.1 four helix bundle protein [candidate division KSB1 bacterium]NIS22790.1 four helix bundle protein [candidate division KSB1 bacterium]NIT69630.1 four helix bundle protein [candidate division KSB1 bacterium]NIU23299.1 four helix bundle protein [candidate division KSB1 bacterium]